MKDTYDVIVIGGGVNGCGAARDLAMRGLSVCLVEKGDLSKGTSWASTGMIHGGLRYLLSDVFTTHKSCKDSGFILNSAPHLVFRIPLMMPILKKDGLNGRINLEGATALFSLYDKFQPLKKGKPHLRLSEKETKELEPLITPPLKGSVVTDEWGIDVPRLCVINAVDASRHGATIKTWTLVERMIKEGNRVVGIAFRDRLTDETGEIRAKMVVNCAGPWTPAVAKMANATVQLRPGKGVHLVLDRRITNNGIIAQAIDGRQVFMIPHENTSLIGTTDDDYFGDLDAVPILEDEVDYLLQAMERVIPNIREARVIKTIAGVRPTLHEHAKYEDDLTRDHRVFDHEKLDNVQGFVTLAGGKLAAYRVMAEDVTDLVCRKLGNTTPCETHTQPLPGGSEQPDVLELAKEYNQDPYLVRRLVFRQGSDATKVLDMIRDTPSYGQVVCQCDPVTEAEIRYCIRHEMVRRASDLVSRCRLAEGPCQGYGCAVQAAMIFGEETNLPARDVAVEAMHLLQDKWQWRRHILSDNHMAAEELYRMVHQAIINPARIGNLHKEVF